MVTQFRLPACRERDVLRLEVEALQAALADKGRNGALVSTELDRATKEVSGPTPV